MPLRIVTRVGGAENVVVLEGWLSGPEVAEFETVTDALAMPLQVDLTHVAGADITGIAALHAQQARGAKLTNASPYLEVLLRSHAAPPPDSPRGRRGG